MAADPVIPTKDLSRHEQLQKSFAFMGRALAGVGIIGLSLAAILIVQGLSPSPTKVQEPLVEETVLAKTDSTIQDPWDIRMDLPQDSVLAQDLDGMFWEQFRQSNAHFKATGPEDYLDEAQTIVDQLEPMERIAQLFLVSWPSVAPSPGLLEIIDRWGLGGIKIFGWNGSDVQGLTRAIGQVQELSLSKHLGIPLFVSTDQEGGWVRHIKDTTSVTPGNMAIGASGLAYDAYVSSFIIAYEMRAMGVNFNFAPTVDVYTNREAHVIGPRAFSSDPNQTSYLGWGFFLGHERARVISTAKHFPGHGQATGDSHGLLPRVPGDLEQLRSGDLKPFINLIDNDVPAILVGHLAFPDIDGDTPASLSSFFLEELLRDDLGFTGLTVTDDMYMEGALEYGEIHGWNGDQLFKQALLAGNDLLLTSRLPGPNASLWPYLEQEYAADPAFRTRVDQSATRVIAHKLHYLGPDDRVPLLPDPNTIEDYVPAPFATDFFSEQAGRSATVVRQGPGPLTIDSGDRVLLVGQDGDFFNVLRNWFPGAREYRFSWLPFFWPDEEVRRDLVSLAPAYDHIIFGLGNPNSLDILQSLEPWAEKISVLSIMTPIYFRDLPWVQRAVAVYGWGRESYNAGANLLFETYSSSATAPISLEGP